MTLVCDCERIADPDWSYCPWCGTPIDELVDRTLDHTAPADLAMAYDHFATIKRAAEEFPEVDYAAVHHRLVATGIHEPDTYGDQEDDVDPSTIDGFEDLDTPDWLMPADFYAAADMAADVDELAAALGWDDTDRLAFMVDALDVEL